MRKRRVFATATVGNTLRSMARIRVDRGVGKPIRSVCGKLVSHNVRYKETEARSVGLHHDDHNLALSPLSCRFQVSIIQMLQHSLCQMHIGADIHHGMTAHLVGQMFADHIDASPFRHPIFARNPNPPFILILQPIWNFLRNRSFPNSTNGKRGTRAASFSQRTREVPFWNLPDDLEAFYHALFTVVQQNHQRALRQVRQKYYKIDHPMTSRVERIAKCCCDPLTLWSIPGPLFFRFYMCTENPTLLDIQHVARPLLTVELVKRLHLLV